MPREPRFNLPGVTNGVLVDVLRLEVENDPSGLVNLVPNPNGTQGGYGWLSPGLGSIRKGTVSGADVIEIVNDTPAVIVPIGGPQYTTEFMPVTPGQYIAARWVERGFTATSGGTTATNARYHAWIHFTGPAVSGVGSPASAYFQPTNGTARSLAAYQVPPGITEARLVFELHDSAAEFPAVGGLWRFNNFTVATAATAAALSGLGYLPPPDAWTDVLGPTHAIKMYRGALALGTLSAEVLDAALDPAVSAFIRPGKRVRLRARDAAGTYRTLFSGELTKAKVKYHLLEDVPDQKRARITLEAVDALSRLAAASRSDTVGTLAELAYVLEGCRTPWNINGVLDQIKTPTPVARADGSTAVDQVEITRATNHAYAWVDKDGVMQVQDSAHMPALVADLTQGVYNATAEASFDTDECINEVSVTRRYIDSVGEVQEETTGHFHTQSIARWGRHRAAFTVAGTLDPKTFAATVFNANATPVRRTSSVQVNVLTEAFIPYAHLDTYARVNLYDPADPANATYSPVRVTEQTHTITPEAWLIDFAFATPTAVAAPQVVPDLPAADPGGWVVATLTGSWVGVGGWPLPSYSKEGRNVGLKGVVQNGVNGQACMFLPADLRPPDNRVFIVMSSHVSGWSRVMVRSDGAVFTDFNSVGGAGAFYHLSSITYLI
jgi:hypothetical protein